MYTTSMLLASTPNFIQVRTLKKEVVSGSKNSRGGILSALSGEMGGNGDGGNGNEWKWGMEMGNGNGDGNDGNGNGNGDKEMG
ncbi:MAG: hypothetical protein Greene07144_1024 [Parcubacteria group bacterium Greene0714_4]|nr:MAG: hypothetical protein Greene07144_1024 [Parcubacteria group bacterium Greene0714_4]